MQQLKVKPTQGKFIVQNVKKESVSTGGILLETAPEASKTVYGMVVAVSDGKRFKGSDELFPLDVKLGDKVLYMTDAGVILKIEGKEVVILTEDAVLAIEE